MEKIMFRAITFLILELLITLYLIVAERNIGGENQIEILNRYKNIVQESCVEISNIMIENFKNEIVAENSNLLINSKLMKIKEDIPNLNTIFLIDYNGSYKAFPSVNDEQLKNVNFETNRKLLNANGKDKYNEIYDLEECSVFVATEKIFDINGQYIGTIGVNINLEDIYEFAKRMYNKEDLNYKIEIDDDGNIFKVYNTSKREKMKINMSEENKKKLLANSGNVVEKTKILGKRYIFFRTYGGDKKYLLEISFETTNSIYKIIKNAIYLLSGVFIAIFAIKRFDKEHVNRNVNIEKEINENIMKMKKDDEEKRSDDFDLIKKIYIFEKDK